MKPRVRSRWFDTAKVPGVRCADDLAKQEFKQECDINVILARYDESPRARPGAPVLRFGEFAEAPEDFLAAQLLVKEAEEKFEALPAAVRERFGHSPVQLLRFLSDPLNVDEARKLGLVNPAPPAPPAAPAPPAPAAEPPKVP